MSAFSVLNIEGAMFRFYMRNIRVKMVLNVLFLNNFYKLFFRFVGGYSYSFNTKSAAMFGLDARIALVIFGALSVISGASLYSILGSLEVKSTIQEMNELGKAYEQYILDTGVDLPFAGSNTFKLTELVDSEKEGWKGPYINFKMQNGVSDYLLRAKNSTPAFIFKINDSNWGQSGYGSSPADTPVSCSTGTCYTWISFIVEEDIALKILQEIDGNLDGTTGDVRVAATSFCPGCLYVLYKYNPAYIQP